MPEFYRWSKPEERQKLRLENLPEFKEGAKSDLVPHQWEYNVFGDELSKQCTDIYCGKEETIKDHLTPLQAQNYRRKIKEESKLFEKQSGYCRELSIKKARINGTFNPTYNYISKKFIGIIEL